MKSIKAPATPRTYKVLFVGNSFTARNDVPGLITKLAAAAGVTVEHTLLNVGGASLRLHWNKGDALREIYTRRYDFIVLQEQSTLPAKNPTRMRESIRLFEEPIRGAGAKMVLYMTWARRDAPELQQEITHVYECMGSEFGAIVVPAGVAWQKFLAKHDRPVLHDKDGSHPTLAGSYLAACAFVRAMFKICPSDVAGKVQIDGLSDTDAKLLASAVR